MEWTQLNWKELDRLRAGFLNGGAAAGPYWNSRDALEAYDLTYAQRIGWKWQALLKELKLRGWRPASRTILDWGCGSGVASRRVIAAFGAEQFDSLILWDHAPHASDYAAEEATRAFPTLDVSQATAGFLASTEPLGLLVVSHVINELDPAGLATLLTLAERAEAVLWCEPGTRDASRQLSAVHDQLRGRFRLVAPCTHQHGCPMLAAENERHWCHFFASSPPEIFANPDWVKFGQRAGIDLRSLPYAFIALDRAKAPAADPALGRIIGRPEAFKPYTRLLNCDAEGLAELVIQKRDDPRLIKELDRSRAPLVYRWRREGLKILGGESLESLAAPSDPPPAS